MPTETAGVKGGLIGQILSACPHGLTAHTLLLVLMEQGSDKDSASAAIRRTLDMGITKLGEGLHLELVR